MENVNETNTILTEQMQRQEEEKLQVRAELNAAREKMLDAIAAQYAENGEGKVKDAATECVQLKAKYDSIGKLINPDLGDYLHPIHYEVGMSVEKGKWYFTDDPELPHEAIENGVSEGFYDRGYFDFVE